MKSVSGGCLVPKSSSLMICRERERERRIHSYMLVYISSRYALETLPIYSNAVYIAIKSDLRFRTRSATAFHVRDMVPLLLLRVYAVSLPET